MRHLYIHVPFCSRRCVYCDFAIAVRKAVPAAPFVTAVVREHEHRKLTADWEEAPLETLYLGGGTPSLLPSAQVADLLRHFLQTEGTAGSDREVTIEANPEDVTDEKTRAWAAAGVNRVSLGVQSFDSSVLEWMHRSHSPEQATTAVTALRAAGIASISLDLIAALPPQLQRRLVDDLERALVLEPDHISVYGLTAEPRTALARWIARGSVTPATDVSYSQEFLLAHETLTAAGYEHYEVSNYARKGRRSRHNQAYWDGSSYAGLGPSAHGFYRMERRWNVAPWVSYQNLVSTCGDPTEGRETLTPGQSALERTYLGLRVNEGLAVEETARFNPNLLATAVDRGWARSVNGRWCLTASGWLRLDEIVAALTTSAEGG